MGLKLGAATYTYLYAGTLDDALGRLADMGFRACELTLARPHPTADDLDAAARRRLAQRLASLSIQPVALQPTFIDVNLASLNDGFRQESIRQMRACIEVAADLGVGTVVTVPGRMNPLMPLPFDLALDRIAGSIAALLPSAERLGVTLGIESTPPSPLPDTVRLLRLVERLGHPNVKVTLDVANNFMYESPLAALEAVCPHLALVHLSDTKRTQWLHAAVGDGEVDFAAVAQTLRTLGYDGVSILETTVPHEPDDALRRSLAALRPLGWET